MLNSNIITKEQKKQWQRLINELPEVPTKTVEGVKVLAPAQEYSGKQNVENPELYAIFPYRIYGIEKQGLDIAQHTFSSRAHKGTGGWQQDAIYSAYLGLADNAANYVMQNFLNWNKNYRFPVMFGPNYDWIPDQCHGTVAMSALQRMLVQYNGDKIILLPAWPADWDVDFKLHAPKNTIITGKVENGKLVKMDVTPKKRSKDIIVLNGREHQ
jgi:hypothetical protein